MTCLSLHHPQKNSATISPSAIPTVTALTQHTVVVILPSFFIQLCRFAGLSRTATPHTPDKTAAPNKLQTTMSIKLLFPQRSHKHNPCQKVVDIPPLSQRWVIPTPLLFQATKFIPFLVTYVTPSNMLLATNKNYPISSLRTFYFIYQLTTLTHLGKN